MFSLKKKRLRGNVIVVFRYLMKTIVKTETDPSGGFTARGKEATGTNCHKGNPR